MSGDTPAELRKQPSFSELRKLSKHELVYKLWGEIRTNIEINAQLRAVLRETRPGQAGYAPAPQEEKI